MNLPSIFKANKFERVRNIEIDDDIVKVIFDASKFTWNNFRNTLDFLHNELLDNDRDIGISIQETHHFNKYSVFALTQQTEFDVPRLMFDDNWEMCKNVDSRLLVGNYQLTYDLLYTCDINTHLIRGYGGNCISSCLDTTLENNILTPYMNFYLYPYVIFEISEDDNIDIVLQLISNPVK